MWNISHMPDKLRGVDPRNIIVYADYDLTLVDKDEKDFDRAPLTAEQYVGLQNLSREIARLSIVTARGERSTFSYLKEHEDDHGPIDITIASNSGHVVLPSTLNPDEERRIIPIPVHTTERLHQIVVGIHKTIEAVKTKFPKITADYRRLCGAVIYNFIGPETSQKHQDLHCEIDFQLSKQPEVVRDYIEQSKKHREVDSEVGTITQGYVDFKPTGMDKGPVTHELFQMHSRQVVTNPFVIVAGDSGPDYRMMETIDTLVRPERRLFISVGNGLLKSDEIHRHNTGRALLDVVTEPNGHSAVQSLHKLLATVSLNHHRPVGNYG